jgi:hypothetical protein
LLLEMLTCARAIDRTRAELESCPPDKVRSSTELHHFLT